MAPIVDTAQSLMVNVTASVTWEDMNAARIMCMDTSSVEPGPANSTAVGETMPQFTDNALLYIVVVLSFYAFAIVVLMVKYIQRENEEAELAFYFTEFIKRDRFQDPTYLNKQSVDFTKRILDSFYRPLEFHESCV